MVDEHVRIARTVTVVFAGDIVEDGAVVKFWGDYRGKIHGPVRASPPMAVRSTL
jgi:hypothetical protein